MASQPSEPKNLYWTHRAKWIGNILPLLIGVPFIVIGLIIGARSHSWRDGVLIWFGLGVLLPALTLNWLGLAGNQTLKSDFYARNSRAFARESDSDCLFFGVASSGFRSLLDPHEDIGFICLHENGFRFYGEKIRVEVSGAEIKGLGWKANPHSWLGLGGFALITYNQKGEDKTLLMESREKSSLLANKKLTHSVLDQLKSITEAAHK